MIGRKSMRRCGSPNPGVRFALLSDVSVSRRSDFLRFWSDGLPVQFAQLLQTKLQRPGVTGDPVSRERLIEPLNRGLSGPLTLVCASAGFGKTTLVSSWLKGLGGGQNGSVTPSLPWVWLSLDDYQAIRGEPVYDFLNSLVRHWPPPLHTVLISRLHPPLPLAGLRAKGLITEIRSRDLRFTRDETAEYLDRVLSVPPSEPTVALLEKRTEGWIADLHLASLSLRAAENPDAFLAFVVMVDGVIPWEDLGLAVPTWRWCPEMTACFLFFDILIGIIGRLPEKQLVDTFVDGARDMLGVALI